MNTDSDGARLWSETQPQRFLGSSVLRLVVRTQSRSGRFPSVSICVHPWFKPMLLARVEGNVTATRKHPSFEGWRLVICQPIGQDGTPEGSPQIAIDAHGAGMHQRVVISSDGSEARKAVKDPKSPARWLVVGIVDEKEPGVPV